MYEWVEKFQWQFPGGKLGLLVAILSFAALILVSYFTTLRKVSRFPRILLLSIRILFAALVLFCLCRPAIVREEVKNNNFNAKMAVVFDSSSSMRVRDENGDNRITEAIECWEKKIRDANRSVDFKFFRFDEKFLPLDNIESLKALESDENNIAPTRLFDAITEWNEILVKDNYSAAICLSDGIDCSETTIDNAERIIRQSGLPNIFIPMVLPVPPKPQIRITRIESPSEARTDSIASVSAGFSIVGFKRGSDISIEVTSGDKTLFLKDFKTESPGEASRNESMNIEIKEPGKKNYTLKISKGGKVYDSAEWCITGIDGKVRILLYQGGLDWGTRFIRRALEKDKNLQFDVKFAPDALGNKDSISKFDSSFPVRQALDEYDAVILLRVKSSQVSGEIDEELEKYIARGGSLLFIISSTDDASQYTNSPLEKLLPAFFRRPSSPDTALRISQEDMKIRKFLSSRSSLPDASTLSTPDQKNKYDVNRKLYEKYLAALMDVPPLVQMSTSWEGENGKLFAYMKNKNTQVSPQLPNFQDFAVIDKVKPGATALALHPAGDADKKQFPLILSQYYGRGKTSVLATDALWRWKLSMKSESESFEQFWKGLAGWLTEGNRKNASWKIGSMIQPARRPFNVHFVLPERLGLKIPDFKFTLTDGKEVQNLTMKPADSAELFQTELTLEPEKKYTLAATSAKEGITVLAEFSSMPLKKKDELSFVEPDKATLKKLASASPNSFYSESNRKIDLKEKVPEPEFRAAPPVRQIRHLWHKWWIFSLIIGLFLAELIIRRQFRLV